MPTRSLDWYAEEWHEEQALADDLALALQLSVKFGRPPEQAEEVLARYRDRKAERD
jgi:hypothetical protein